ncbi:MAG: gliding motility-associated C-terminal domain-containing protein [Flavobacteriales bacterium]
MSGQDLLLLTESFETGGASFSLNLGGPGSNSGTNQWVINNQYSASGSCPVTPDQNMTTGGTINGAPFSNYLHIENTSIPSQNACFDQDQVSDQFSFITNGFCTFGLDEIHISFYWIGQGNSGSFGSLWYQADGGGWIQVGNNLSGANLWTYEDITLPEFSNVGSLQFGFRFVSDGSSAGGELSLGVDDINIVASLTSANPAQLNITAVAPSPVCEGTFVTVSYELSEAMCDGVYQLELSAPGGGFPTPYSAWAINIAYPTTAGSVQILLPSGAGANACYTFRLNRISPAPAITGIVSACFEVIECPNTITTAPTGPPVVLMNPEISVCVGSVIDVAFNSTGSFNPNNNYILQLSEPDGTFSVSPPVVGSSPDPNTYDPMIVPSPGSVGGLVPDTEPGCNYFLRIISTSPSAIGTIYGPFCIEQCDITTNDQQDLSFCITECSNDPDGSSAILTIDINTNGQNVTYNPGNIFTTQLLSSQNFSQIGPDGIFGEVTATSDTQLEIVIPCIEEFTALGLSPGMNYLRIKATNPSDPNNNLGTLIHLTVGFQSVVPIDITSYDYSDFTVDDTLCAPASVYVDFSPYDPNDNSTYEWTCNAINNGNPFVSPNGADVNFILITANQPNLLVISVQRTNYGCVGPMSPEHTVVVAGPPVVNITGDPTICIGDTIQYNVGYISSTYYAWNVGANPNEIMFLDTSGNVLNVAFADAGTYPLNINVLNECGAANDSYNVNVSGPPTANAGADQSICTGETTTLNLNTFNQFTYNWSDDNGSIGNTSSVNVSPQDDQEYYGILISNIGCRDTDTVAITIVYPDLPQVYYDSICPGGLNSIRLEADMSGDYLWSTGSTDAYAWVQDTGIYTLAIDVLNLVCPHFAEFHILEAQPDPPYSEQALVCLNRYQPIRLEPEWPGQCVWSTGQTYSSIFVSDTGLYSVNIYSAGVPCPISVEYTVTGDSCAFEEAEEYIFEPLYAWVPNTFTANNDNYNEVFGPVFSDPELVVDYNFTIYDRWGTMVFNTTDPYAKWTGGYRDGEYYIQDGFYQWILNFRGKYETNAQSTTGFVLIIR